MKKPLLFNLSHKRPRRLQQCILGGSCLRFCSIRGRIGVHFKLILATFFLKGKNHEIDDSYTHGDDFALPKTCIFGLIFDNLSAINWKPFKIILLPIINTDFSPTTSILARFRDPGGPKMQPKTRPIPLKRRQKGPAVFENYDFWGSQRYQGRRPSKKRNFGTIKTWFLSFLTHLWPSSNAFFLYCLDMICAFVIWFLPVFQFPFFRPGGMREAIQ